MTVTRDWGPCRGPRAGRLGWVSARQQRLLFTGSQPCGGDNRLPRSQPTPSLTSLHPPLPLIPPTNHALVTPYFSRHDPWVLLTTSFSSPPPPRHMLPRGTPPLPTSTASPPYPTSGSSLVKAVVNAPARRPSSVQHGPATCGNRV